MSTTFVRKEQKRAVGSRRRARYKEPSRNLFDDEEEADTFQPAEQPQQQQQQQQQQQLQGSGAPSEAPRIEMKRDARLERAQAAAAAPQRRRPVRSAEVLEVPGQRRPGGAATDDDDDDDDDGDDDDDDDEEEQLRERKQRAAQRRAGGRQVDQEKINEELRRTLSAAQAAAAAEGSDEEYEEVSESDDEGAAAGQLALMKPTFVPKAHRVSALEEEKEHLRKQQHEARRAEVRERKRKETLDLVLEAEVREQDLSVAYESDENLPDDTDHITGIEGEIARKEWEKRRELRFLRYKEECEKAENEQRELERRRNLTAEQREQEDIEYDQRLQKEYGLKKEKKAMGFMQKFWHKGAFYQDTLERGLTKEEIFRRDATEATGVDRFDKSALPEAMQVRGNDFGKRGRTKWTHLTNEDTTYQKDKHGGQQEYAFATGTFAKKGAESSANQAYQAAENHMMFRHQRTEAGLSADKLGSAKFGAAGRPHKDKIFGRVAKR